MSKKKSAAPTPEERAVEDFLSAPRHIPQAFLQEREDGYDPAICCYTREYVRHNNSLWSGATWERRYYLLQPFGEDGDDALRKKAYVVVTSLVDGRTTPPRVEEVPVPEHPVSEALAAYVVRSMREKEKEMEKKGFKVLPGSGETYLDFGLNGMTVLDRDDKVVELKDKNSILLGRVSWQPHHLVTAFNYTHKDKTICPQTFDEYRRMMAANEPAVSEEELTATVKTKKFRQLARRLVDKLDELQKTVTTGVNTALFMEVEGLVEYRAVMPDVPCVQPSKATLAILYYMRDEYARGMMQAGNAFFRHITEQALVKGATVDEKDIRFFKTHYVARSHDHIYSTAQVRFSENDWAKFIVQHGGHAAAYTTPLRRLLAAAETYAAQQKKSAKPAKPKV